MHRHSDDPWSDLGKPPNVGMCFAITACDMEDEYQGDLSKIPRPGYDHGIWLDTRTDNYLVARPNRNGEYDDLFKSHQFKRVR